MRTLLLTLAISTGFTAAAEPQTAVRRFQPDDLYRVRRVGAAAWSPDGRYVAIELGKPGRWLSGVPTADLMLLDVVGRTMRSVSPASVEYLGFFNASWSPDGRRLAFLSVGADADVRLWVWTTGASVAAQVANLDVRADSLDRPFVWVDTQRLAVIAWDEGAGRSGSFYMPLLRGRNAADAWRRTMEGRVAAVSVMSSAGEPVPEPVHTRLVALDVATGARQTLARGRINQLAVAPDACCVGFLRNATGTVASYFEVADRTRDVDQAYDAVSRGTAREAVDLRTGVRVSALPAVASPAAPSPVQAPSPPRPGARRIAVSPGRDAELYVGHDSDGSRLWIAGGGGRPLSSSQEIWRANEWMAEIQFGRPLSMAYTGADGTALTAWLLLPPGHVAGTRLPVVTIVYPGTVHGSNAPPASFSPVAANFEHPQLFAALGYAVLLPSMPASQAGPRDLESLSTGVLPAVEASVANGIADPDRVAVLGQSAGGFAALGLITQTTRFRAAIASAGYSNLVSLYGTFYGQFRHGDAGRPETAQVMRMLQLERGAIGLAGSPWTEPDRYRRNSPLLHADKVETPLMLIHGELDFIPVQQAEEFFTALLRHDRRAVLLRYAGETHTIDDRANVLDLWQRLSAWLAETMAVRSR